MNLKFIKLSWPYIAIILAHFIWGANFIISKLTLEQIPPMSLAFSRFALALVFLAPFLITERKKMTIERVDLPKIFLTGIFMITLHIAFFFEGLTRTSSLDASVLLMTIPAFSVMLGWWFLKEKVYLINLGGIAFGLLGSLIIIGLPSLILGAEISSEVIIGNVLILLSAITWVIGAVLSKSVLKKYSTLTLTAFIFLVGTITFFIPAVNEYIQNPNWVTNVTFMGILGLLYISLASSVSAYFLFEWSLSRLGVIKADLFQYIEPVIVTILGVLILSEQLTTAFVVGTILIGIGAYWGTLGKSDHKHHKAHRG